MYFTIRAVYRISTSILCSTHIFWCFLGIILTHDNVKANSCKRGWPIVNREGPDSPGWTMVSPDQQFHCSGQVTRWSFLGKISEPWRAIVFRPTGNGGSVTEFQIVGINDIPASAVNTPVSYTVPENERIPVKSGDVIGWSFGGGVITWNGGGNYNVRWVGGNLHASLAVNQTVNINTGVGEREYSIEATVAADETGYNGYICEHDTLHLECEEGRILYVTSAIYGRQDEIKCPTDAVYTTSCASRESLQVVQNLCNGKHACEVQASSDVFGDPCQGTEKYLEISYSCIEGQCKQFHTTTTYDYTYMPKIPSHADSITFKVRANNDVHVALARQPYDHEDSPKIVEIVLGGWSNQESAIRDCQQCGDQTREFTPNLLSPDEDRHFNISFTDGYVQVGLVGEEPIMSHQFNPDEFQFNYLGISTGFGSTGNWTICNYIPTPIYLGCYIDAGDRALPNHLIEDHEEMTLEKCWAHCRSFGDQRYASLQYTYQCFCGSEYDDYGRHGQVSESDCSHQCSGNGRQYCGAGWRNSVYDLGGTSTIRLMGGAEDKSYAGRVELYDSGSWSSICGHGWDLTDSHVACKMLGYQGAEKYYTDGLYGQGDGNILLNYVDCRGDENDLFECSHWGLYNHDCSHADDVAVKCNNWGRAVDDDQHHEHDKGNDTGTRVLIAFGVLSFLTFVFLIHRQKQLRVIHNRNVTFGETFLVTFCGKQLSSPNTNMASSQPNTISGSVGTAQQGQDAHQVEMPDDALPSYDVAITESTPTNSDGGIVNSNFTPYNPDIYDASTIEDPSLPPPPSYDAVVAKSDEYQVPDNVVVL